MSVVYHSYDSSHAAVNDLVAGAYAEHTGTLGFDETLSSLSRNAVENKVITARILEDEDKYLLKTEAESKYAVEYSGSTPATIQNKIYSVGGDFYAGDSASGTLHELGKVKKVNNESPDANGNVNVNVGVKTVNGTSPDANGNVNVTSGVSSVNGQTGAVTIDVGVKKVNNASPDANGNVTIATGSAITASISGSTLYLTW